MRGRRPPRPQAPQFLKEEMAKLAEILEAEKERKSAERSERYSYGRTESFIGHTNGVPGFVSVTYTNSK